MGLQPMLPTKTNRKSAANCQTRSQVAKGLIHEAKRGPGWHLSSMTLSPYSLSAIDSAPPALKQQHQSPPHQHQHRKNHNDTRQQPFQRPKRSVSPPAGTNQAIR